MSREHLSFPGSQGATLVGRLETPEGGAAAYALFAHCFTCSKDIKSAGGICRELMARGIAVLRFDFTGIGESGGEFADTNFSSNVEDLIAAADFLRRERRAPALLIGHSLGGTAILAAASRIPEAVAVAIIGAPGDTRQLHRKLSSRLAERRGAGNPPNPPTPAGPPTADDKTPASTADAGVRLDLGGPRPVRIRQQLLDDLGVDHMKGVVAHLGKPLLIFHSPADRIVDIADAERLFSEARHPKSFISLGRADHLLSDPHDAAHVGAVLAAWAGRYLDDPAAGAPGGPPLPLPLQTVAPAGERHSAPPHPLAPGEVEVTGDAHSLRQEVRLGIHHLIADEPLADGGTDLGATPYGLLLAALGTCTSMTLRLYADRKRLPLTGIRVRLRHSRHHAADCEHCDDSRAQLERIDRDLDLQGTLTDDQRARLLAIADRCPVHRTLTSHIDIVTRLV